MNYNKPPLTIKAQISHIEAHYTIKCKYRDLLKDYLFVKYNVFPQCMGFSKGHTTEALKGFYYE